MIWRGKEKEKEKKHVCQLVCFLLCSVFRYKYEIISGEEGGGKRGNKEREVGDWRDRESIDIKSPKRKAVNLLLLLSSLVTSWLHASCHTQHTTVTTDNPHHLKK